MQPQSTTCPRRCGALLWHGRPHSCWSGVWYTLFEHGVAKRCSVCGADKPLPDFYADPPKRDGRDGTCIPCILAKRKVYHAANLEAVKARNTAYYLSHRDGWLKYARKVRQECLAAYGGACRCCGETTPEFLGIDHVNDDGEKHRRELKGYGRAIYQWLKKNNYPQDGRFQLLCHNCNMSKGLYGGCPHQGPVPYKRQKELRSS